MVAAASASRTRFSSTTTTSVSASPLATPPALRRSAGERLDDLAAGGVPQSTCDSCPPPGAAVAGQHLVGRARAPLAGPVRLRRACRPRPPPAGRPPASSASTSAASGNSVRSPISTSSTSRSYASGLDSVNASPYWKSIAMSRTSIVVPGTLEPNLSITPSSGCTRMTSWLLPSISTSCGVERQVRRLLEQHRDLGDPARQPLAGAHVERHPGPAPVLDAQPHRHVRLGGGVRRDVRPPRGSPAPARRPPSPAGTARGRCRRRCRSAA